MNWYWHVRIFNKEGKYWHGQIITDRNLREIEGYQDFYAMLTGCKMLIEGMSEQPNDNIGTIHEAFHGLWGTALTRPNGGDGDPSCRDPNCTYGQEEAPAPLDTRVPQPLEARGFRDDEPLILDLMDGPRRAVEPKPE